MSLNIRLGSPGEYETNDIKIYNDKTTKSAPNTSNSLLMAKFIDLFK